MSTKFQVDSGSCLCSSDSCHPRDIALNPVCQGSTTSRRHAGLIMFAG